MHNPQRVWRWWPARWRCGGGGFTLIELLIVVAIIAVLAAIAVPNFLEAQTRSKVSRYLADQRALVTAVETYRVDWPQYPAYNNPRDVALMAGEPVVFVPVNLTTPVAYLTALFPDVFTSARTGVPKDASNPPFYMHNYEVLYLGKLQAKGHVEEHFFRLTSEQRAKQWTCWSFGPDGKDNHGVVQYDATNGTISAGDLMHFGP